ncbi:adipocyte plasma membrane-associated protein-like [Mya arenaria]|uniref:adipocyte plasma membrane-associated protein-like n=1 Tax=Mya arenaria TaxID=6604 RepID=UPI0022DFACAF|nr:adipocyte plasma membrane-associated protein-like [Mya arenaria]
MDSGKENHVFPRRLEAVHALWAGIIGIFFCLLTTPIDPLPYTFPYPLPGLEGPLEKNSILQKAERWFDGQIFGPESFTVDENGTLYTGTADGKILQIDIRRKSAVLVVRTGLDSPECGSPEMEPLCGRPKGMKFGPDGKLYVVDSYKGLLRVNIQNKSFEILVANSEGSEGVPFKFLNSLDIDGNGIVYFTDSSDKWQRRDFRYAVLENRAAGRLMRYDPRNGLCSTVLSGLYLANGVSLSRDGTHILVNEMSIARIRRYYLTGEKAGTSDIFIDNLPGYPDNIKPNSRGNLYVGMGSVRFQGSSPIGSFLDIIGPYPKIKQIIAAITPLKAYNAFMPKHALCVEIDSSGKIVSSLHDPGATKIGAVSEVFEFNNTFFIGHFQSPYLGVLNGSIMAGNGE